MAQHVLPPPPEKPRGELAPWLWLGGVLLLAGVLRAIGNGWGLPQSAHLFSYHPDEFHSLRGAFNLLLMGDPNPHFYNYGSLYLYLVACAAALVDTSGTLLGSPEQAARLLHDWTLAGRDATLVCGVLTVLVVFLTLKRLVNWRLATVGALSLAVLPLHVLHSHYATVDVTQALFVALAIYFSVGLAQLPSTRSYLLAGLCAGLAASVKYNGALVILAPLVAHVVVERKPGSSSSALVWQPLALLGAMVFAFAVTSPYTFLDWAHARPVMLFEMMHMRVGEEPARGADPNGWLFHTQSLMMAGAGVLAVALLGLVGAVRKGFWRPLLGPVVFGVAWFIMIGGANVRYQRYELALTPLLALLVALAPLAIYGRRSSLRLLSLVAPAFHVGLGLAVSALLVGALATQADPRDEAPRVIERFVPPGQTVALPWDPWFNAPALDPCNGGSVLRKNPLFARFSQPLRPLLVIGVDAKRVLADRPQAVIYSNFEIRDALRVKDPNAQQFVTTLAATYLPLGILQRQAPLDGLWGWQPPQDWLYAFPTLHLYVRKTSPRL